MSENLAIHFRYMLYVVKVQSLFEIVVLSWKKKSDKQIVVINIWKHHENPDMDI